MSETLSPELCVIGAGAGATSIVAAGRAMGASVVCIDQGDGQDGNRESLGLAALNGAARVAHAERIARDFGVHEVEPRVDFAVVRKHVQSVLASAAPNATPARLAAMGATVLPGPARFISPREVQVGEQRVRARRFVIATGGVPRLPKLPGIETIRPLDRDTIFDLTELPTRLIVLGAQAEGLELAQAFRRLGSEVTVLDTGKALAQEDPELAAPVLRALMDEGVIVREGVSLTHVEPRHGGLRLFLSGQSLEETLDGSHLLVALGHRARIEGLALEAAGVAMGEAGPLVDDRLRTTNRRIHAIGDCGDGHSARDGERHAAIVIQSGLLGGPARLRPGSATRLILTDPEIAITGLEEAQARATHRHIRVARAPFSENARAHAQRSLDGPIKVVSDAQDRVLGAGIVGARAGELIGLWQLAVLKEMDISEIAGLVLPQPSLSEISRQAAIGAIGARLQSPWVRRLSHLLRRAR